MIASSSPTAGSKQSAVSSKQSAVSSHYGMDAALSREERMKRLRVRRAAARAAVREAEKLGLGARHRGDATHQEQLGLFDDWVMQEVVTPDYDDGLSLDEQFERWVALNPHVLEEFIRRARVLKRQGLRRFGAKAIIEGMRYDRAVRTGGDTFKLNNNYTSRLVRRAMEREEELAGFFELRALKSPPSVPPAGGGEGGES